MSNEMSHHTEPNIYLYNIAVTRFINRILFHIGQGRCRARIFMDIHFDNMYKQNRVCGGGGGGDNA